MNPQFKEYLLKVTKATDCKETEEIQSLWSGYGKISRFQLVDSTFKTVVVKNISFDKMTEHPRGWNTDFSHQRKVKSYEVETNWYEQWNKLTTTDCKTPEFLGSFKKGNEQWIILEDLDASYPIRKQELTFAEVKVCLKWLANFHGIFLNKKPEGLWEIGTYWNLKTRPEEFEKIEHLELKAKAHKINKILNQCNYQTLVHGDAKVANFCFSNPSTNLGSEKVAGVDFQYVGGGCGMKDVAYFLGSCLSGSECELYQNELLDYYFLELEKTIKISNLDFKELEQEWRKLYPMACADFTRFLLGWMPTHSKINNYNLDLMERILSEI